VAPQRGAQAQIAILVHMLKSQKPKRLVPSKRRMRGVDAYVARNTSKLVSVKSNGIMGEDTQCECASAG
jgi:hypothetical protein